MNKISKKVLFEWGSSFILMALLFFIRFLSTQGSEGFFRKGASAVFIIVICLILIKMFSKEPASPERASVRLLKKGFCVLIFAVICFVLVDIYDLGMDFIHGTENYEIYPSQITYIDTTSGFLKDNKVNYAIKKDGSEAVIISVREEEGVMSYMNCVDSDDLCEIQIWPRSGYVKRIYSDSAERMLNMAAANLGDERNSNEGRLPVFRLMLALILAVLLCIYRWSDTEANDESQSNIGKEECEDIE